MSTELLLEGANAYTSLAEIATASETSTPEAIPTSTISVSISLTFYLEC
ncbi:MULTISPECIES: hypothetical protein [unclassified Streptosporangium]